MDHHCLVLGTCIGSGNYKFFFLTLIYSAVLINFSLFTSIKSIFFYTEEFNVNFFIKIFLEYFRFNILFNVHISSRNFIFIVNLFHVFSHKVKEFLKYFF